MPKSTQPLHNKHTTRTPHLGLGASSVALPARSALRVSRTGALSLPCGDPRLGGQRSGASGSLDQRGDGLALR
ncbi:hypothetical protein VE02_01443 [Pseudogymnoascus sp. 03VT05]|nr:hypothetical protein VE02_01443 [Pseudogymnoascus sp. 03VT05]